MKIKLTATTAKTADSLNYNSGKLNLSGVETDLTKMTYTEPAEGEAQANPYIDQDGVIHIHLTCDTDRQFLFLGDNYLRFYDVDMNGFLDDSEFTTFCEVWNKSEAERRAFHKSKK